MPYRLPVFPLGVVLFPGAMLPLHIFEPRYRQLLADCLADDRRFGITPMSEEGQAPPPGAVGCVAHIRATQPMPDGRSNIVVSGEARFVLRAYRDDELPYRVASVEEFDDAETVAPDERVEALKQLATRYLEALHLLHDSGPANIEWPDDAHTMSFQAAAAVDADVTVKQHLLELRSTAERIDVLLGLLPSLTSEVTDRARIHVRARSNGKGGPNSEIVSGS